MSISRAKGLSPRNFPPGAPGLPALLADLWRCTKVGLILCNEWLVLGWCTFSVQKFSTDISWRYGYMNIGPLFKKVSLSWRYGYLNIGPLSKKVSLSWRYGYLNIGPFSKKVSLSWRYGYLNIGPLSKKVNLSWRYGYLNIGPLSKKVSLSGTLHTHRYDEYCD